MWVRTTRIHLEMGHTRRRDSLILHSGTKGTSRTLSRVRPELAVDVLTASIFDIF